MDCPACGYSSKGRFKFIETHSLNFKTENLFYSIYQCPECLSEFADPMKPASSDWYIARGEYYGWRWEFGEFIKDIIKLLPTGKILEIGCGEGIVLAELKGYGYDVIGLDINNKAIEKAKTRGFNAYPATVEEFICQFPLIKFNAIIFFHVLEHLESPSDFLANLKTILEEKRLIFLSVPNPNRIRLALSREDWDYPPHHLLRFSFDGIQRLLKRSGFRLLKIKEQPNDLLMSYVASSIEIDVFLKNYFLIDILQFNRYFRNIVRFPFGLAFISKKLFFALSALIKNPGKKGNSLYIIAMKC